MKPVEYQTKIYELISDFLLNNNDQPDAWVHSQQLTSGTLDPNFFGSAHMIALFSPRVLERKFAHYDRDLLIGKDDGKSLVAIPPYLDFDFEEEGGVVRKEQLIPNVADEEGGDDEEDDQKADRDQQEYEDDEIEELSQVDQENRELYGGVRPWGVDLMSDDELEDETNVWDHVRALQYPAEYVELPTPEQQEITILQNYIKDYGLPHAVILLLIDETTSSDMAVLYWLAGENPKEVLAEIQRIAAQKIKWLTRYPIK